MVFRCVNPQLSNTMECLWRLKRRFVNALFATSTRFVRFIASGGVWDNRPPLPLYTTGFTNQVTLVSRRLVGSEVDQKRSADGEHRLAVHGRPRAGRQGRFGEDRADPARVHGNRRENRPQ